MKMDFGSQWGCVTIFSSQFIEVQTKFPVIPYQCDGAVASLHSRSFDCSEKLHSSWDKHHKFSHGIYFHLVDIRIVCGKTHATTLYVATRSLQEHNGRRFHNYRRARKGRDKLKLIILKLSIIVSFLEKKEVFVASSLHSFDVQWRHMVPSHPASHPRNEAGPMDLCRLRGH